MTLLERTEPRRLREPVRETLRDAHHCGAPGTFTAERIAAILAAACEPPSQSGRPMTHWTHRELRDEVIARGIVESIAISRVWHFPREAEGGTPRKDPEEAVPKGKDQRNFTDPESKIMKTSNKGFDQCGNAQAVANEQQIIVAADVTNQANDVRQVEPPLAQTQANLQAAGVDEKPKDVLADAGYFSEENMHATEARGMTPFIATQRLKHNEAIPESPQGRTPRDLSAKQRMARKLRTKKRRETYSKRKRMIEPVFGQIKACRHFLHCQIRGLHQMQGEWTLV